VCDDPIGRIGPKKSWLENPKKKPIRVAQNARKLVGAISLAGLKKGDSISSKTRGYGDGSWGLLLVQW
jgi:hypothetical protein